MMSNGDQEDTRALKKRSQVNRKFKTVIILVIVCLSATFSYYAISQGTPKITKNQALEIAQKYSRIPSDAILTGITSINRFNIPRYLVAWKVNDRFVKVHVDDTGDVIYFLNSTLHPKESSHPISTDMAYTIAEDYLENNAKYNPNDFGLSDPKITFAEDVGLYIVSWKKMIGCFIIPDAFFSVTIISSTGRIEAFHNTLESSIDVKILDEVKISKKDASETAISYYRDCFKDKYDYNEVQVIKSESEILRLPKNPSKYAAVWLIRTLAEVASQDEAYNLCVDVYIDPISGDVIDSIIRP